MVNNNKMDGIDVLCKFYQLSDEEQKTVLKRLISSTIKDGLKEEVSSDLDNISTSLINMIYSEDEELKNSVFKHFVQNYESLVQEKREELCDDNHNFTEWDKNIVERPHYALDGDSTEPCYAPVYIRVCKKCGLKQVAYSKTQRKNMELYTEYKRNHPVKEKKLINKPNTEN